jgi:preprotein translocase subunit SecG
MTLFGITFFIHLLNLVILLMAGLLIILVLIQRGRGGGLAGAFGGAGGSSPFGSKAGDTFTRITIVWTLVWVLLICGQVKVAAGSGGRVQTQGAFSEGAPGQ